MFEIKKNKFINCEISQISYGLKTFSLDFFLFE
jgi:hypothetical protein